MQFSILNDFEAYLNKEFPIPEILTKPIDFDGLFAKGVEFLEHETKLLRGQEKFRAYDDNATNFVLEGELTAGTNTRFAINGKDIKTTKRTWLFGELEAGARVKAKGVVADGERICTSLLVYKEH